MLENLQTFLYETTGSDAAHSVSISDLYDYEFKDVVLPPSTTDLDDAYGNQISAYVAFFIVKKIKLSRCIECTSNLVTNDIEFYHNHVYPV